MANNTKERILETALELFSEKGYSDTNLREITARLGMTKSAFYKHYESKEALWDALVGRMEEYYGETFASKSNLPEIPDSWEGFRLLAVNKFDVTIRDESIVTVRRLILEEQFRDEKIKRVAANHFLTELEMIFTHVFGGMIEKGLISESKDPEMLAFSFAMPISALVQLCDREPEREEEAREKMNRFITFFEETYKK